MKKLLAYAGLLVFSATVFAWGQSSPGLQRLQVPTAAQWNSYFSGKQDYLGYTPVNKAGDTMLGRLVTVPSSVASGFNLAPGSSPSSPINGDLWSTTAGVFAYVNGSTVSLGAASGTVVAGGTLTNNRLIIGAGGSTVNPLSSAGTTSQVLIGGGPPTWGSVDLSAMVTATLAVANGGTGTGTAGIGAVNNISGRSYSGFTGTGNLVGSAAAAYSGTWTFNGSGSGVISFIGQAAAGTWNWEWPTTAGLSGQVLVSAGGTGPMTWAAVATTGPAWKYTANTQSISTSTYTTVNIVNSVYDTASICNTTTHVCTPTTAGYYLVGCIVRIDGTNGTPIHSTIAGASVYKNTTKQDENEFTGQLDTQAASVTGWSQVETLVQVNGSSDTLSCRAYSDDVVGPGIQGATMYGAFVHA